MDADPLMSFARLRFAKPDDALREIAGLVREGCNDPTFLRLLADHIDPDKEKTPFGTKFKLHRTSGKKAPPRAPNYPLRQFLERFMDIFPDGEDVEAVKAEAASRFGVSRSTCTAEISFMRQWQKSDPAAFDDRKFSAQILRECGDPEFQPLWPDK